MLKTIIKLIDTGGGESLIAPNAASGIAVQSATITECVNNGEELTLGSTCANALEATLFTPNGTLKLNAGAAVAVYKEDDSGKQTKVGVFTLEKPTRPTANTMKITGYDNVSKLDKDMTAWLAAMPEDQNYTLTSIARMVCSYCGLTLVNTELAPNGAFSVPKFSCSSVTGRQLMQWIGEVCCSFCRANADGEIEFDWYKAFDRKITASGELYYFKNGLTYEDYITEEIEAVQVGSGGSEEAAISDELNCYTINGNPILNAMDMNQLGEVLGNIQKKVAGFSYVPCKVSIPANLDIHAGHLVEIIDKNGVEITTCVMTKTQTGQTDTLESTGSHRRDSTTAVNNRSVGDAVNNAALQTATDAKKYTDQLDEALDQLEVLKRLTAEGADDAIYLQDGKLAIKATAILTGVLDATLVTVKNLIADHLLSESDDSSMEITSGTLILRALGKKCMEIYASDLPILYMRDIAENLPDNQMELSPHHFKLGGTSTAPVLEFSSGGGVPELNLNSTGYMKLSWKSNGDGTYTLIGT